MGTEWMTRRAVPWQLSHVATGSESKLCRTSNSFPQSGQT